MRKSLYTGGLATLAIVGIVAVLVVIGGAVYFSGHSKGTGDGQDTKNDIALSGSGTLRNLLSFGQNVKCTFTNSNELGTSSGTVYVADRGNRVRGDFSFTGSQGTFESHMILRDQKNHVWGSGLPQGMIIPIPDDQDAADADLSADSDSASPDFDQNVMYDCDTWSVNESMFDLPAGVEFVEVGNMMPPVPVNAETGSNGVPDFSDKCGLCQQAPAGTPREQCLQAYGCN